MELKQALPKWIQNCNVSNITLLECIFFIKYTYFQGIKCAFNSPHVRDQEKCLNNRLNRYFLGTKNDEHFDKLVLKNYLIPTPYLIQALVHNFSRLSFSECSPFFTPKKYLFSLL